MSQRGFALRHTWDRIRPLLSTSCVGWGKLPNLPVAPLSHLKRETFSQVAVRITCYTDLEMLGKVYNLGNLQ